MKLIYIKLLFIIFVNILHISFIYPQNNSSTDVSSNDTKDPNSDMSQVASSTLSSSDIVEEQSEKSEQSKEENSENTSKSAIEDNSEEEKIKVKPLEFKTVVINYNNNLSYNEVQNYLDWINFKNTFTRDEAVLKLLPKSFQPQDSQYFKGILKFNVIFFVFGCIVTAMVLFYIAIRFGCNKCVGPLSLSKVDDTYKVVTWVILGLSLFVFLFIYALIIIPSISLG